MKEIIIPSCLHAHVQAFPAGNGYTTMRACGCMFMYAIASQHGDATLSKWDAYKDDLFHIHECKILNVNSHFCRACLVQCSQYRQVRAEDSILYY